MVELLDLIKGINCMGILNISKGRDGTLEDEVLDKVRVHRVEAFQKVAPMDYRVTIQWTLAESDQPRIRIIMPGRGLVLYYLDVI